MARHMRAIRGGYQAEAIPDALDLVGALRKRDNTLVGLVTGNTSKTAAIKLEMAGFDPTWFPIGAFGNESAEREDSDAAGPAGRARDLAGSAIKGAMWSSLAIRPTIFKRRAPSTPSRSPSAPATSRAKN